MWDEKKGSVTRAYDEWRLSDGDIRAFTSLGSRALKEFYDRTWEELATMPGDPEGPDLPDLFDHAVGGLWPDDCEWVLLAGALKDAVTSFEIYIEKATHEVLGFQGHAPRPRDRSPNWNHFVSFWSALGTTIDTAEVNRVRDLRHLLTHRRGELRTENLRRQFEDPSEGMQWLVALQGEQIVTAMDDLAIAVRATDVIAYAYSWGGAPLPPGLNLLIAKVR